MTMDPDTDTLIASLVDDLRPARVLRRRYGLGLTAAAAAATLAIVAIVFGFRSDISAGRFDTLFLIANGLFLILGVACAATVIAMGNPQVGSRHFGWRWVAAAACLLPLSAIIILASGTEALPGIIMSVHEMDCLFAGVTLGLLTAAVLVFWLRRGAPTSPERAGLLVGVASGCIGIFAFAFHCSTDTIYHVGLWHSAPVLISALLGRLLVPRLVRW
jgi:hypothetical protein